MAMDSYSRNEEFSLNSQSSLLPSMDSKAAINQNEILLNRDPSANIVGVQFPINRRKAASTLRTYGVATKKYIT